MRSKIGNVLVLVMALVSRSGKYVIVDPEHKKKKYGRFSKRCCLLLIVLVLIAVIAGGTVGILKAIQSSGSPGRYLKADLGLV